MKTKPYQNHQKENLQLYSTAAWHLVRIFPLNLPDFYKVNNNKLGSNQDTAVTELSAMYHITLFVDIGVTVLILTAVEKATALGG
jgi:hypothetical protein